MIKKVILLYMGLLFLPVFGQNSGATPPPPVPEVKSTWPGVLMRIPEVKRIPGNRLLFAVSLVATAKTPPSTLIGTPTPLPPEATYEERFNLLPPTPFSLTGSTMTEEKTQKKYEMLAPDPKGPTYRPSTILGSLSPGKVLYMTIQFPAPPPPLPDPDGKVPRQTVSIQLPNAQGPITGIVIPPAMP